MQQAKKRGDSDRGRPVSFLPGVPLSQKLNPAFWDIDCDCGHDFRSDLHGKISLVFFWVYVNRAQCRQTPILIISSHFSIQILVSSGNSYLSRPPLNECIELCRERVSAFHRNWLLTQTGILTIICICNNSSLVYNLLSISFFTKSINFQNKLNLNWKNLDCT